MPKWTPPETKLLLTAIVIALAVHLLLFGLFRYHVDRPVRSGDSEFPPVLLQMQKPEYRELARWLWNHDPALIAAPDAVRGYGAAAQEPRRHAMVADLPQVPALMIPATELPAPSLPRPAVDAPIPAEALQPVPTLPARRIIVAVDGHELPELSRIFTRLAASRAQIGSVEITVSPSVLPGVSGPCRITASSGDPEWDRTAKTVIAATVLPAGTVTISPGGKP